MNESYSFFANLEAEAQIPENGILSRTLYNDDHVKVLIFGFAAGQELSAHTAPMAASLYFVRGEATLTLGADVRRRERGKLRVYAARTGTRHRRQDSAGDVALDV